MKFTWDALPQKPTQKHYVEATMTPLAILKEQMLHSNLHDLKSDHFVLFRSCDWLHNTKKYSFVEFEPAPTIAHFSDELRL